MTVYILLAAACAFLALLFFSGHGTFLVCGVDGGSGMSAFYDADRLRFVCGGSMTLLTLLFALSAVFLPRIVFWLPMAICALVCAVLVCLCNTVCALPQPEPWYRRTAGMFFLGLCVLVIFALSLFGKHGTIDVTPGADSFDVRGSFTAAQTVAYRSVQKIELESGWENGTRLRGVESSRFCEGKFRNDTVGDYTMFAYTQCDARVVIYTDSAVLALNAPTAQETKALYDLLSERVTQYAPQ